MSLVLCFVTRSYIVDLHGDLFMDAIRVCHYELTETPSCNIYFASLSGHSDIY